MNNMENRNEIDFIKNSIIETLQNIPYIYAVILFGSCSRNEETYFLDSDGKRYLFSDFDIDIIVDVGCKKDIINQKLGFLNHNLKNKNLSPLFEISWSFIEKKRLKFMDKKFIVFEKYTTGEIILGPSNVFLMFPRVTLKNLNFSELNSIINHRLANILYYWNTANVKQQKYMIARNTLDIITVILPYEGYLIPTYHNRIEIFSNLEITSSFAPDFVKRIFNYLDMKINYSSKFYGAYEVEEMLKNFIGDMKDLYLYLYIRHKKKVFRIDKRKLLTSIKHIRFKRFVYELFRKKKENQAYTFMLNELAILLNKNGSINNNEIKSLMLELYGNL